MKINKELKVYYHERPVGTMALTTTNRVAFEYDSDWLKSGFSISPFSLPLKQQVYIPDKLYFNGLFGVFADSLPDAWGNILLNRLLKSKGINPDDLSMLDRLAIVGSSGMGALTYRPEYVIENPSVFHPEIILDELAEECSKILITENFDTAKNTDTMKNLDKLYQLGGTSGGARPKIMTVINGEDWIIKFPASVDGKESGKMEYDYSLCAKACGIKMPDTKLFDSHICKGYFGIKRFDRQPAIDNSIKHHIHMLTVAALLELDFTQPSLDYHSLMKLTKILTRNNFDDLYSMFRRMCFNVFAHNRDDHSKNFTFIYNEKNDEWRLSPAYDLTYSRTYYGEHTTTVDGNGQNPGEKELLNVGVQSGLDKKKCLDIIYYIRDCVTKMLGEYLN